MNRWNDGKKPSLTANPRVSIGQDRSRMHVNGPSVYEAMRQNGASQKKDAWNTPIDWGGSYNKLIAAAVGEGITAAAITKFLTTKDTQLIPSWGPWLVGGAAAAKKLADPEQKTIVINFTNNITLSSSSQKEDVLAALQAAIRELEEKFNAVVNLSMTEDSRLAFDG